MAFLVKIIDVQGESLRKIDVDPGQIITVRPGEQQVVFLKIDPSAAKVEAIGDEVRVSIDGQEPIVFEGFSLYLEDGTAAFSFVGQGDVLTDDPSVFLQGQDVAPKGPQDLAEFKTAAGSDQGGGTGSDGSVNPGPLGEEGSFEKSAPPASSFAFTRSADATAANPVAYSQEWVLPNQEPIAGDDAYDAHDTLAGEGAVPKVILAGELLANDSDGNNGALTIEGVTMDDKTVGEAKLDENGNVTFKLNKSFASIPEGQTKDIKFTYTITDGQGGTATATITITIIGSQFGDDLFIGDSDNNKASGGEGDDTLFGKKGNDTLYGGKGNDKLNGGDGDDKLYGGNGDDWLTDLKGNNILDGGKKGIDTVDFSLATLGWIGKVGDSFGVVIDLAGMGLPKGTALTGGGSTAKIRNIEIIIGSSHKDIMIGNEKQNIFKGGAGDDILMGFAGDDTLEGGKGKDTLEGGTGNDTLDGGTGNDKLYGGKGINVLDGGDGTDTAAYERADSGVVADLATGTALYDGDRSSLLRIEDLLGSAHDDTLSGNSKANKLSGNAGKDVLNGRGGNDKLEGGKDEDVLNGGKGDDVLLGDRERGEGNISLTFADTFVLSGGNDTVKDFRANDNDRLKLGDVLDSGAGLGLSVSDDDIVLKFDSDGNGEWDASMTLEGVSDGNNSGEGVYSDLGKLRDALKDLLGYDNGDNDLIIL